MTLAKVKVATAKRGIFAILPALSLLLCVVLVLPLLSPLARCEEMYSGFRIEDKSGFAPAGRSASRLLRACFGPASPPGGYAFALLTL